MPLSVQAVLCGTVPGTLDLLPCPQQQLGENVTTDWQGAGFCQEVPQGGMSGALQLFQVGCLPVSLPAGCCQWRPSRHSPALGCWPLAYGSSSPQHLAGPA